MKSILYVGGALMLAACIYGFVDYKKTNATAEFSKMYEEKEVELPEIESRNELKELPPVDESIATDNTSENDQAKEEKLRDTHMEKRKELDPELFSRAPLRESPKIKTREETRKSIDNPKSEQ